MKSGASRAAANERSERRAEQAAGSESRPDLVDATQYDFDRLERAVSSLVAQQAALAQENQALRARLAERDQQIGSLESELEGAQERRETAIARVDALIEELDRLDAALDGSMATSPAGAEPAP